MHRQDKRTASSENQTRYALAAFLAIVIFVIIYKYNLGIMNSVELNDLKEHAGFAQDIYLDRMGKAWLNMPYLLWHVCVKSCIKFLVMPVPEAVALTCGGFALLHYFAMFYLVDRTAWEVTGRAGGALPACTAGMLSLVQPLYMYWFNPDQYLGQFSINPLFNPTHSAVRPIGLLCFMLAVDLILRYKGKRGIYFPDVRKVRWLYVLFAFFLLLSALAKPTFMFMLLPAGAVYLLVDLAVALCRKNGDWKKVWGFMWRIACASIPALVYLVVEYVAFYIWAEKRSDSHVAIYPFLTAWRMYSPNIVKSVVLAMAFPIWMVMTNWKYFLSSVEGRLGMLGYAVGTLEFCFVVETGERLGHLNFAWTMMSGMLLIWVMSAARLVQLTVASPSDRWHRGMVIVGWMLLSIYFFSGLYFINPSQYII